MPENEENGPACNTVHSQPITRVPENGGRIPAQVRPAFVFFCRLAQLKRSVCGSRLKGVTRFGPNLAKKRKKLGNCFGVGTWADLMG